jgi:hypothetical protein
MFHDNPNITPEQIKNLVLMLAYDINIEHKFSESGAHINLMDFVNVIGIPLPQEVIDKLKTRNIVKLSHPQIKALQLLFPLKLAVLMKRVTRVFL